MATAEADIQSKVRKDAESSKDVENHQEILEEPADAERQKAKAQKIKLSSEKDLESFLKLAEELKEKVDSFNLEIKMYRRRIFFSYLILVVILFGSPFVGYTAYSQFIEYSSQLSDVSYNILLYSWKLFFIILISSIFFSVLWNLSGNKKISDLEERIGSDKLALREVLQLLREVHSTIADREDWSILKRAEFRIRLSRFDLSEKKESVFNFFS